MRRHKTLVGCLPGTDALTLARVHTGGKRPAVQQLLQVAYEPEDTGPTGLKQIAQEHGLLHHPWVWVLPPEQYQVHLVEVPDVPDDEVHAALRLRVKDLIGMPLAQAALDSLLLPDEAFRGRHRMAFTLAAKRKDADAIEQMFGRAGIHLAGITVADVALRNLANLSAQSSSAAVLNLGSDRSYLNAVHAGELCLNRELALGQNELAADPAEPPDDTDEEFNSNFDFQLEPAGTSDSAQAVDTQLESLALELQRSFDYFDTQLGLGSVNTLRVLADASLDNRTYQYLNDRFHIQSGPLTLDNHMDFQPGLDPSGFRHDAAVAIASTLFRNGGGH